ncbi:ATP-dependent RNA helicase DBP3 [Bienertia sinuspersici]
MNSLFMPSPDNLSVGSGIQPRAGMEDEMQEQANVLQKCVRQLEGAEATRVSLVTVLKEAVQDQKLIDKRCHLPGSAAGDFAISIAVLEISIADKKS